MAEEQVSIAPQGETASPASSAPSASDVAATKAKLQGNDGQASPQQAAIDPKSTPQGKQPDAASSEVQPMAYDKDTADWLKSAGYNPENIGPSEVSKLVKSYRESQSEMSRKQAEAQRAEKAREILEKSRVQQQQPQQQAEKVTPMRQFEQTYEAAAQNVLRLHGVDSLERLAEVNPTAAKWIETEYLHGRQQAWEQQQAWEKEQHNAELQRQAQEQKLKTELEGAQRAASENLMNVRREYPEFDQHAETTGVMDFLNYLEAKASWPKTFTLSNPAVTAWLAKASKAIYTLDNLDAEKGKWQQEYERKLIETKKAELPKADSDSPAGWKRSMGRSGLGNPGHGVSII